MSLGGNAFDESPSPEPDEQPTTAVLVLSQYVEEAYALDLLSESTERTGYLLKDRVSDVDTFTDAVRRVANGGSALDPEVVALLLGRRRREDPLAALSPREREVLGLMAEGRSNAAMAEAHGVSERAVEKHVTAIFSKLDLPRAPADHRRVLADAGDLDLEVALQEGVDLLLALQLAEIDLVVRAREQHEDVRQEFENAVAGRRGSNGRRHG